ncbi:MAG: SDR family NAD(P)-dependent oxidoreductase [Gemmatimonadota bacterium]|nr:SDR family NAD(P)-dependent oxidoreductase [Gemmatimonadota bacterium]
MDEFVKDVAGQTVIITGSNRGIGLGWVKHYLNAGDSVIATCRTPEEATDLIALKEEYGNKLLIVQLELANEEDFKRLGDALAEHNVCIDIAINNAGSGSGKPFGEWDSESFAITFQVHTIGSALFAQMVTPLLNDGAKMVLTTSGVGSITRANRQNEMDAYAIAKAGVNMLAKRMSVRLADRNIIVAALTPGSVLTGMNPNGTISVEESVGLMSSTLDKLTVEDSGSFFQNDGTVVPW